MFAKKTIKAVIFDLDDTLVKTWVIKSQHHKFVAKKYYKIDLTDADILKHWGKPMNRVITGLYGHVAPEAVATANYSRHAADFPKELQSDTIKTLDILQRTDLKLGLLTSWWRHKLREDFKGYNLDPAYFTVIQGCEDSDYHKPNPRVFEPTLRQLAKKGITDGVVYVGDMVIDYQAARDAGLHFVGITTGLSKAADFKKAGARQIITKLSELPATLGL